MLNCTCHPRQPQSRLLSHHSSTTLRPVGQRTLGFMLDEKMFAFYYELSPNSR